jgi:hypothetical protein
MPLQVSYLTIIIFIVCVIILIIFIASIYYDSSDTTSEKVAKTIKLEPFVVTNIKPEIEYNSYTFKTNEIDSNISYIINGSFSKSSLSLYFLDENEREYTQMFDGNYSIILTSNLSLANPSFKYAQHKCLLVPLTSSKKYKIIINKVNDLKILSYKVNYTVNTKPIHLYDKDDTIGTGEYDVETYSRKNIPDIDTRVYPKVYNQPNKFSFNGSGKFVLLIVDNLYNFDIEGNDNINIKSRKGNLSQVSYKMIEVENPSFLITNLDYEEEVKNVNTEYIEFITAPNYLVNRFLNGVKKKPISYNNLISDKVYIYKLI